MAGVTGEMCAWLGETLIAMLRDAAGPGWTPPHEAAWAAPLEGVTVLMLACQRQWSSPALETPLTALRSIVSA